MIQPWSPILEANQGTLSVVALALALGAFIWELYRANTQHLREQEQEIQEAITLIEDLEQYALEAADGPEWQPHETGIDEMAIMATAMRALAAAHVKKPTVSLPLLRAAHLAEYIQKLSQDELDAQGEDLAEWLSATRAEVERALEVAKRRVVFRRTEERKVRRATARAIRENWRKS
ncbi:MAG: hypothetical protein AB7G40_02510 [Hyphomonadaceae bacterium]